MRYIISLLPVIPTVLLVTAAVYAGIYVLFRKKREKPGRGIMAAEFLLVGWVVMFVYVTQIMSFGNGLGSGMNLQPFRPFVTAFRYGSNNAGSVWQFLLNIIMFVPLGVLLPVVFRKLRSWRGVLAVSLAFTVATELVQQLTGRGTDIDDVIANTVGGLCGFALWLAAVGVMSLSRHRRPAIPGFGPKLCGGAALLLVVAGVFVGLKFCDGSSKYGNLYYGHLIPDEVEVTVSLDDTRTERAVYRYSERITTDRLQEKLLAATGFEGEWEEHHSNETYYSLSDGDTRVIFIFPYNKWSVYYEYGIDGAAASAEIDESGALEQAWAYLEQFGIGRDDVAYSVDNETAYSEDNYYFDFLPTAGDDGMMVYGDVLVELGRDGRLISVTDNRIWCEYAESAPCISMADSIDIAQEVGCGSWAGKATVESVEEAYTFIRDTGYLIPVWKINGVLTGDNQTLAWHPEIDAVQ